MSREEEIKKELYENTLSGRAPVTEKLTQEGIDLGWTRSISSSTR